MFIDRCTVEIIETTKFSRRYDPSSIQEGGRKQVRNYFYGAWFARFHTELHRGIYFFFVNYNAKIKKYF